MNPLHKQRLIDISVYDIQNTLVTQQTGTIQYNSANSNFSGQVDMGNLASGSYLIRVHLDGNLTKQFTGIQTITTGKNNIIVPQLSLVTGDINNDNQLDISDYNILVSCFGSKLTTSSCPQQYRPSSTSPGADILDDNGQVDGADYNEFLRELSVQVGQ